MLKNYERLRNGVIRQVEVKPFQYGFEYSNNYNKISELSKRMAHLRLGYLIGVIGRVPENIVDIGYGNGDFLEAASKIIPECYGSDIAENYPVPPGVKYIDKDELFSREFDVACFFDVLEHVEDIYLTLNSIQADYLCISLPNCEYKSDEWFSTWKHRKENEHLWFFDETALVAFMLEVGYKPLNISYIEDVIRVDENNKPNILSGVFQRIYE